MFGKRSEIIENLVPNDNEQIETEQYDKKQKKNNKKLQGSFNDSNNTFIFYGENQKFYKQIEIYAILKSDENQKQLIIVDSQTSMSVLRTKITEAFQHNTEYQNLKGLAAINLTNQKYEVKLPTEGKVDKHVNNGDLIYFDFTADEIWVKCYISVINQSNQNETISVSLETKVNTNITYRKFKYMLIKCGINTFLNSIKSSNDIYHYVVTEIHFLPKSSKIDKINNIIGDKSKSFKKHGYDIIKDFDNKCIDEIFDFKSKISITIKLRTLENIMFTKLKSIPIDIKNKNKLKWEHFKETNFNFKRFKNSKIFNKEKLYIFHYFNTLFNYKFIDNNIYEENHQQLIDEDININYQIKKKHNKEEKEKIIKDNYNFIKDNCYLYYYCEKDEEINVRNDSYDDFKLENGRNNSDDIFEDKDILDNRKGIINDDRGNSNTTGSNMSELKSNNDNLVNKINNSRNTNIDDNLNINNNIDFRISVNIPNKKCNTLPYSKDNERKSFVSKITNKLANNPDNIEDNTNRNNVEKIKEHFSTLLIIPKEKQREIIFDFDSDNDEDEEEIKGHENSDICGRFSNVSDGPELEKIENNDNFIEIRKSLGEREKRDKDMQFHYSIPKKEKDTTKNIKKNKSKKISVKMLNMNLCHDFKNKFNFNSFIEYLTKIYRIELKKDALKTVSVPEYRKFKTERNVSKNLTNKMKKKFINFFKDPNYPIKKNLQTVINFSIFSLLLAIYFVYLIFVKFF